MSKLSLKNKKKHNGNPSDYLNRDISNNETTVCIGANNVKVWSELKIACKYNSDVKFTSFLLSLAQKYMKKRSSEDKKKQNSLIGSTETKENTSYRNTKHSDDTKKIHATKARRKKFQGSNATSEIQTLKKSDKKEEKNKNKRKYVEKANNNTTENLVITLHNDEFSKSKNAFAMPVVVVENIDYNVSNVEKQNLASSSNETLECDTKLEEKMIKEDLSNHEIPENIMCENTQNNTNSVNLSNLNFDKKVKHRKKHKAIFRSYGTNEVKGLLTNIENMKFSKHKDERSKLKRKVKHDIRKAPQLDVNLSIKSEISVEPTLSTEILHPNFLQQGNVDDINSEPQRVAIKIKLCTTCNTRHLQDTCPLIHPNYVIKDEIIYSVWEKDFENTASQIESEKNECLDKSNDSTSLEKENSFSKCSLPSELYLEESETAHGLSVFSKCDIKQYTQFGPLIGNVVKEVDIAEDCNMRHLWEVYSEEKFIYVNTEDCNVSNWIRFIKPAPSREQRNVSAMSISQELYMVTTKCITAGEELLFWQDDVSGVNKKKLEKTNCGGCNLSFTHPLYYRLHCSVFHDVRYSLTIRKYHCKVCGAAVLGKDNIMKHAVELHNGQGAYQCQFCKKFFLRLNYLEMHRTYGCAANPHRSRPLCDFCGRKFCQPQKLKVHIKRMHSDMSEVLREFQCKSCLKLLGSRAALQRHVKEVHQKQIDGSCTCVRCGKLFQNKSNLKIHMLTHSGVKPFKCKEDNCNAAFTTKQCLQFHYKKVHGFAENIMPKIERSVEYTFAAYAGVKNPESDMHDANVEKNLETSAQDNLMSLDESTDVDDISLPEKQIDDPPPLHSPVPIASENSSLSNPTPPMLEPYTNNSKSGPVKVQSKGSKKWLGEDSSHSLSLMVQQPEKEIYQFEKEMQKPPDTSNMLLEVRDSEPFDKNKLTMNLNVYSRHESSNASLLVEAALDSVSDIHMTNSEHNVDVGGTQSCTESLVNNLYLSHQDNLADVAYNHSEDLNESRDINLISPSVNDHISVTDHDLNDDIPNRGISLDYSALHNSEFSPPSSPNVQSRSQQLMHEYNVHPSSPPHSPRSQLDYTLGQDSEIVSPGTSPPRYDFRHTSTENLSSDESNGIVAQNLSLNNAKEKLRLDVVGYKSHYGDLDNSELSLRKYDNLRQKYETETDRSKIYDVDSNERIKSCDERDIDNSLRNKFDLSSTAENIENDMRSVEHPCLKLKQFNISDDFRTKYHEDEILHTNKYDQIESKYDDIIRNKLDIGTELRGKSYNSMETDRTKTTYENSLETEIRNKAYDVIDGLELRTKAYDNIETEFRSDRNFEPLVLNPAELQGLDMTARTYHNFHTSGGVQGINRFHHIYSELDRPSVDLRLGYSPPPYSHTDVLRVVSLDLTPPGRHSVDLSLRSHALHSHQLPNSRLLADHSLQTNRLISTEHNLSTNRILSEHNRLALDQTRILPNEHNLSVTSNRLMSSDTRLLPDTGNRLLSDHTTNRLLSNDQLTSNRLLATEQGRMLTDDARILTDQSRLIDQSRLLGDTRILQPTPTNTANHELIPRNSLSPPGYSGYPVSPSSYTSLAARTHGNSPGHTAATSYHHYSAYY